MSDAGHWRDAVPRVVVSQCLELAACRYNGQSIRAEVVRRLAPWVELVPVCPEVEIGLGVPRPPIRLVAGRDGTQLVQPATGRDLTATMGDFGRRYLDRLGDVDGFILKSRSPSCGLDRVRVYGDPDEMVPVRTEHGAFARLVLERYGDRAIEHEGRLTNLRLRHHFLTRLFALARLRRLATMPDAGTLVHFHAAHKLLLMAYRPSALRSLGRLVANPDRRPPAEVLADYLPVFRAALRRAPSRGGHLNVIMHARGYFADSLTAGEKRHLNALQTNYRQGRVTLAALVAALQSWIIRFDEAYLAAQAYFDPYPAEFFDLADSRGTDTS